MAEGSTNDGADRTASLFPWHITGADAPLPIIATAIHDGHAARPEVEARFALSDTERLREEDPFTAIWTDVAPVRIVAHHSRFEIDLNRPREKAIYRTPEDAWGLTVWKEDGLAAEAQERSLGEYDAFYAQIRQLLQETVRRHGAFVVLDLHTYNHRRNGPEGEPAPTEQNPEVNIGTGTLTDRAAWEPLIQRFIADLRGFDFLGRQLDVRENVKFRGGQFGRWIHETFPGYACVLSIEFKKFFMDEWTGVPDPILVEAIRNALAATLPGLRESVAAHSATGNGSGK